MSWSRLDENWGVKISCSEGGDMSPVGVARSEKTTIHESMHAHS
jgi:hypothetical protein